MSDQNSENVRILTDTASERENVSFTGVQSSKDDIPGCTKEACSFRDANHEIQKRGIAVLGVSADSTDSHKKFAEKYGLPFPLLSDTDSTVSRLYGAYGEKSMFGKKYMGIYRSTFLIDKNGIVRKVWPTVKPDNHANEVLSAIEALQL